MTSFYSEKELSKLGIKGKNVLISRKASIYGEVSVGDNVRIDDYCVLSGKIKIGSYVHISAYCALYGKAGIEIGDFSGLSPRCTVFSQTDDFSGNYLTNPMTEYTNVTGGPVKIKDYVQIGSGSIIMPNLTVGEGGATGALSFVKNDIEPWTIQAGIPAKYIKDRSKKLIVYAKKIQETNLRDKADSSKS